MGGLPRRATVLNELKRESAEAGAPVFVVDAGNLSWKSPSLSDSRLAQQREKARVQHAALKLGGIDGMLPGAADLALGSAWLQEQAREQDLPFVAANLSCDGAAPFPGARRVERGGLSLVVAGVLQDGTEVGGCTASDPLPALQAALTEAGEADLVVLLAHQDPLLDETLARSLVAVDIVINSGTGAQYNSPKALPGAAVQLASGSRGKKLGVARVALQPGGSGFVVDNQRTVLAERIERAERRLDFARERLAAAEDELARERAQNQLTHYTEQKAELEAELAALTAPAAGGEAVRHTISHELLSLGQDVEDEPAVAALVEEGKGRIEAAAQAGARLGAVGGPFVGSAACAGCHPGPTAQWQGTAHASAWQTLVDQQRSQDLDCFTCHVTGAHDPRGPQHPAQAEGLTDVGCESCHGPGKEHVASPTTVDMVASPGESVCTTCHDGVKDEGRFDLSRYLPEVVHGP